MTTTEILAQVAAGKVSAQDAAKLLEAQKPKRALYCKVSEKGALSLYGINRQFPVSLYADQWERVLDFADEIRAFIKANEKGLKTKE